MSTYSRISYASEEENITHRMRKALKEREPFRVNGIPTPYFDGVIAGSLFRLKELEEKEKTID